MEGVPTFTKEYTNDIWYIAAFGANVGKCTMKFPYMEHLGIWDIKFQNLGSATVADTTDRLKVEVWVHSFAPGSI